MSNPDQTRGGSAALSPAQHDTLRVMLNLIIPPSDDGHMPGAADYDVWGYICDAASGHADGIRDQLDRLGRHVHERSGRQLASLNASDAQAMVDEIRVADPGFLADLAVQTINCYYQQDRVLEAIGMEARAPYPKGYEVESGDLSLLDPVRRRGKVYRDA